MQNQKSFANKNIHDTEWVRVNNADDKYHNNKFERNRNKILISYAYLENKDDRFCSKTVTHN